ncbi:MAG: hypothetical protein PT944_06195 [Actinomycetaceae bacterium]|nr:hypothetical protein [Arcanobacterium sp.]MDD7687486.1 hypothetical protein [Actinomycetaceae bacterium]MDY5272961.1 hypothetical protein [Arcanobacterium sp.]
MRRTGAKIGAVGTIALLAVCLTACQQQEVPQPHVTNTAEEVVTQNQYATIAQQTEQALADADKKGDANALTARIGQPARAQRTAQYKLRSLKSDTKISTFAIDAQAAAVSSGAAYPRSLVAFGAPTDGQNQRTLTAWQQENARANYQLWGQVSLFPTVELPTLASTLDDAAGYPKLNAGNYLTDPATVTAAYAAYNASQKVSGVPFQKDDPVFTQLKGQLDALRQNVGNFGTISMSFADSGTAPVVVSTDDRGLVVIGEMKYSTKYESKSRVQPITFKGTPESLMLSGSKDNPDVEVTVDKPLTSEFSLLVAFYIPAKNAGETVQVIGASSNVLESVKVD